MLHLFVKAQLYKGLVVRVRVISLFISCNLATMSSNSSQTDNVNGNTPSAHRNAGNGNGKRPQEIIKRTTTTVSSLTTFFDKELEENRAWTKADTVNNMHKLIDREYTISLNECSIINLLNK